jgi:translation elongation factor EF-1alpha
VRELIVCINKMDCDLAGFKEERYNEIKDEMVNMLVRNNHQYSFTILDISNSIPNIISYTICTNVCEKLFKLKVFECVFNLELSA